MPHKRLGEILVGANVITHNQLARALSEQRRWGGQVGKILIDEGFVTESVLVRALGKQLKLPVVGLAAVHVDEAALATVTVQLAEQHSVFPFRIQGNSLSVAMSDPMNMGILDELRIRTRLDVRPHISGASEIDKAIRYHYKNELGVEDSRETLQGRPNKPVDVRETEVAALQRRLSILEASVTRDEDVIRKLLGLLANKKLVSREEILAAIK